jgi:hypothetical protein
VAPDDAQASLRELRFVGPATADVLADAGVTRDDVSNKRVSHAQLVEHGVNPGVAARIRREHSLQWSYEGGEDLDRRAEQVRGLKDDERQWVAESYGDDAEADGSGGAAAEEADWQASATGKQPDSAPIEAPDSTDHATSDDGDDKSAWREGSWPNGRVDESFEREEAAWREASAPTPVADLDGVDEDAVAMLARAGITSVRSLATAHVEQVADSLGVSSDRVEALREAAREHVQ